MRITNAMMVNKSKINLNGNKSQVDRINNQMSNQKKITKPSDDPIIAIRSLRLRTTLSTVTQFYENNIPDTESWMEVTETALNNMKDILTDAYKQVVYGSTDSLNTDNRKTILEELKQLQKQIYSEGNSDYAGRTVFTGYKTNKQLTFQNTEEAKKASYSIEQKLTYQDIEVKKYYTNKVELDSEAIVNNHTEAPNPQETTLDRIRIAYDGIENGQLSYSFKDGDYQVSVSFDATTGAAAVTAVDADGNTADAAGNNYADLYTSPTITPAAGAAQNTECTIGGFTFQMDANGAVTVATSAGNTNKYVEKDGVYSVYTENNIKLGEVSVQQYDDDNDPDTDEKPFLQVQNTIMPTFRETTTGELVKNGYQIGANEIVLDKESGELLLGNAVAGSLNDNKVSITFNYDKTGFKEGELRPEYYYDCVDKTDPTKSITYENFDEDGNWIQQNIYYNIAAAQQMKINLEARDAFDSDIIRDLVDLENAVQFSIDAQEQVDKIQGKIDSGIYAQDSQEMKTLNNWLDAAKKQRDYANQNMHDLFSGSISGFQEYLDDVTLTITDSGSRGERVALTKSRMSVQQSTFKELKSKNEDAELSDLVIDYTAASVAYQAALQAAGKIGKMTLLDYI